MKVAYVRVSTDEQNLDRQEDLMKSLGIEKVFSDKASGKDTARPGLKELLSFVREGDVVHVESISRLARSTRDLLDIIEQLTSKGASFVSSKEALDTTTPTGRFVLTLFGALGALERETLLSRQKEGIASAKARGKHLGRPRLQLPPNWTVVHESWMRKEITAVEAMKRTGMSRTSFYKATKKY
jgi:DNA invertase Pin-like site-specific DNA recombinase